MITFSMHARNGAGLPHPEQEARRDAVEPIAVGVSGAIRHLAGMKESRGIVAIVRNLALMRTGRLASVGAS